MLLRDAGTPTANCRPSSGCAAVVQVVISSSFESAVGLSQLAQLAAAADASWAASAPPQAFLVLSSHKQAPPVWHVDRAGCELGRCRCQEC